MSYGIQAFHPWMNERQPPAVAGNPILFSYTGTITFKWGIEQAGTSVPTKYAITANGIWGSNSDVDHYPVVFIIPSAPVTFTTYASEAAMQADIATGNAQDSEIWLVGDANGRYAQVGTEYWFLFDHAGGRVWTPCRTPVFFGTNTISGFLCDIYTVDVDVADIPEYGGSPMLSNEVFGLCWAANGKHYPGYDGVFKLSPEVYGLHEDILERTELNSRVAGEKSIYPDEFPTMTQLEAGRGILIRYRNKDGSLSGYATDAAKGLNIVWESNCSLSLFTDALGLIPLECGAVLQYNGTRKIKTNITGTGPNYTLYATSALGIDYTDPMLSAGASEDVQFIQFPNEYVASGWTEVAFDLSFSVHSFTDTNLPSGNLSGTKTTIRAYVNTTPPTPDPQPSLQTRWWWTPQRQPPTVMDWDLMRQYYGINNSGLSWANETFFTPWGPVDDTLDLTPAALAGVQIKHEEKWTGPSGAFVLDAGYDTRANVLARIEGGEFPYCAGAGKFATAGYYHISADIIWALIRKYPMTMNLLPFDYYSYLNLRLAVFRVATGKWHFHARDTATVHHQEEYGLYQHPTPANKFASLRSNAQLSTDIWLNANDKIAFFTSMRGKNGMEGEDYLVNEFESWVAIPTSWSCNIHWLHADTAFAKNDEAHPDALAAPSFHLDLIDPIWVLPYVENHFEEYK